MSNIIQWAIIILIAIGLDAIGAEVNKVKDSLTDIEHRLEILSKEKELKNEKKSGSHDPHGQSV